MCDNSGLTALEAAPAAGRTLATSDSPDPSAFILHLNRCNDISSRTTVRGLQLSEDITSTRLRDTRTLKDGTDTSPSGMNGGQGEAESKWREIDIVADADACGEQMDGDLNWAGEASMVGRVSCLQAEHGAKRSVPRGSPGMQSIPSVPEGENRESWESVVALPLSLRNLACVNSEVGMDELTASRAEAEGRGIPVCGDQRGEGAIRCKIGRA